MEPQEESSGLPNSIETTAEGAGGALGAVLGGLIGGPGGAAAGAFAGPYARKALLRVGREVNNRLLSDREDKRAASVIYFAKERIDERIQAGDEPRRDGFFEGEADRSEADEVLEGGLLAAQREHEERKIEYMGYLLANICFDSSVDRSRANLFIDTAEQMTWQQTLMLSVLSRLSEFGIDEPVQFADVLIEDSMPADLVHEVERLIMIGVLSKYGTGSSYMAGAKQFGHHSADVGLVSPMGNQLYSLMELSEIKFDELERLGDRLLRNNE